MHTPYTVLKPFRLGYDSTVHAPTPKRYKTMNPGDKVLYESSAPNGNVWFFDPDGERGKIECGEVGNLVRSGSIALADAGASDSRARATKVKQDVNRGSLH